MYANMSESNNMAYVNNSFTIFKLAYCMWFLFSTDYLSLIFHLDCSRWCRCTFLTHSGKKPILLKGELHQPCDYITSIILTWLMAQQWCHFLLSSNTRQVWPGIIPANHVKRDRPVLFYLCSHNNGAVTTFFCCVKTISIGTVW